MDGQSSSFTNLSRLFSLSVLDKNGIDLQISTNSDDPIEFFIPRDPNLSISPMFIQNVTEIDDDRIFFNYHLVNSALSYFLISQSNHPPQYDPTENYTLLCSSDKCAHEK